jgi:iron complex transport system permease protein
LNLRTQNISTYKTKTLAFQRLVIVALWLGVVLFFVMDLALGTIYIPFQKTFAIVLGMDIENEVWTNIILKIRLPRAVTAVLAGSALAISGLQMQTLFKNPLAGPSILGITAGASLGVAMVMLASGSAMGVFSILKAGYLKSWIIVMSAMLGSGLVLGLVLLISMRIRDNVVVLIAGIMIGHVTIAIVSIWQYFSNPQQIQDYLMWTFGSLEGVSWSHLSVLSVCVALGIMFSFLMSKSLNALLLGENYAKSMGLSIQRARWMIILITSLLAGSITAFCGPIGFIGIAVPHLTRSLLNSSDHKLLIPACCLAGAIVMLFCDVIAKMPGYQIGLPINAVTSLIGAPVVIMVILKKRNLRKSF